MSATEKTLKILPIPLNRTKIKGQKNSEDKKNSKDNSQNSNSSAFEKVKNPSRVQATVLRIRKTVFFIKQFFKAEQKNDVQPTTQDKYKTDPVPSGKPKPVEPEEQETKDTNLYCTFTITCSTILDNMDALDPEKKNSFQRTV